MLMKATKGYNWTKDTTNSSYVHEQLHVRSDIKRKFHGSLNRVAFNRICSDIFFLKKKYVNESKRAKLPKSNCCKPLF